MKFPIKNYVIPSMDEYVASVGFYGYYFIICEFGKNQILKVSPQSFPASRSFQMSQLFASGGQSIGVSVSASVLPENTQG